MDAYSPLQQTLCDLTASPIEAEAAVAGQGKKSRMLVFARRWSNAIMDNRKQCNDDTAARFVMTICHLYRHTGRVEISTVYTVR